MVSIKSLAEIDTIGLPISGMGFITLVEGYLL
jgi:hypothetical protein